MKVKVICLFVFWTLWINYTSAQAVQMDISYLSIEINHSRRIPNFNVKIEIVNNASEAIVHVKSTPMNSLYEDTKIDTIYKIDSKVFYEIVSVDLSNLQKINLRRAILRDLGGYICIIEYGAIDNALIYKFWSPTVDTEKRGLEDCMRLSKGIFSIQS